MCFSRNGKIEIYTKILIHNLLIINDLQVYLVIQDIYRIFDITNWGCYGIDYNVNGSITRGQSMNVLKYLQNNKRRKVNNDLQ